MKDNDLIKVFMNGNSGSGRTTMLYKWKLGETVRTIPSIGFNVEEIEYENRNFQFWDVGGGYKIRMLWRHYMSGTKAFITVIDSSNLDDNPELLQETTCNLLKEFNTVMPFLILANKCDLKTCSDEEILSYVGISRYIDKVNYHIIRTNCFSGEGLDQALEWLAHQFN